MAKIDRAYLQLGWLIGRLVMGIRASFGAEDLPPVIPDEPETASMCLYGTPSTSGNIGLRNGESVTYYDGAVLPPLPEWDKSKYPYAFLCHLSGDAIVSGTDGGYHLHLLSEPCTYGGITSGYVGAGTVLTYHLVCSEELLEYCGMSGLWDMSGLVTETNKWFHVDTVSNDESAKVHGVFPSPVWSNFDICATNGAVKLAAGSDPVPVTGTVIYRYDLNDFSGEYDSYSFRSASGNDGLDKDETIAFDFGKFPLTMQETFEYNRKFMSIGSLSADLLHLKGSDYIAQAGNKISVTWIFPEVKWGISQTTAPEWAIHFIGESGAYYSIAKYSESTKETTFNFQNGIFKSVIANPVISLIEEGGRAVGFTASGDVIYNIKSIAINHSSNLDYMTGSGTTVVTYNSVDDLKLTVER